MLTAERTYNKLECPGFKPMGPNWATISQSHASQLFLNHSKKMQPFVQLGNSTAALAQPGKKSRISANP